MMLALALLIGAGTAMCALMAGAASAGQLPGLSQPAPRSGLVVGQVIDAGTGSPIGGALVDISLPPPPLARAEPFSVRPPPPPPVPFPRIMTGADGRFAFRRLSKGSFLITVVKPGYLEGAYGRRRPGGASQTLVLAEGQKVGGVRIYLFRHAAISGMVLDEAGEPAVGIQIRALLRTVVSGRRRLVYAGPPGWTDDRGVYRIHGLLPGDYLVAAVATQVSVAASTARDARESGVPTASIAEIGAATASGGPTSIEVGDAVLTLGRSAIGPASGCRISAPPTPRSCWKAAPWWRGPRCQPEQGLRRALVHSSSCRRRRRSTTRSAACRSSSG